MRIGDSGSGRHCEYFRTPPEEWGFRRASLPSLPCGQGGRKPLRVPIRCRRKLRIRLWGESLRPTGRGECWIELPHPVKGRGIEASLKWSVLGVGSVGACPRCGSSVIGPGGISRSRCLAWCRSGPRVRTEGLAAAAGSATGQDERAAPGHRGLVRAALVTGLLGGRAVRSVGQRLRAAPVFVAAAASAGAVPGPLLAGGLLMTAAKAVTPTEVRRMRSWSGPPT